MIRKKIEVETQKQFTNLKDHIHTFLQETNCKDGLLNIFVAHTTCGIKVLEGEILLLSDISAYLRRAFPKDGDYRHDIIEIRDVPINERINGYSHMQQMFFSCDATIPVADGKMMLGKWQDVFLIEFDPIRKREIILTFT